MKPDWFATTHFRFNFYSFSSVCQSYKQEMPKVVSFPFNYGYENLDILYDENNFTRHANALRKNPKKIKTQIDYLKVASKRLIKAAKKYGKQQNLKAFKRWHGEYLKFLPSMGIVIAPERVLTEKIKSFLSEDQFLDISIAKDTQTALEQKGLLQIALKAKNNASLKKAVSQHCKKYCWIGNRFMAYHPMTESMIYERIIDAKPQALIKLRGLINTRKTQAAKCKKILANCTLEQKKWIKLYQDLLYWRTTRAEANSLACQLTLPLFNGLARSLGLSREELGRFSAGEIEQLSNKKLKTLSHKRQNFYAYAVNGKLKVVWGTDGKQNLKIDDITEFKGVIANKGKCKGKVKVVHDLNDLYKVDKGDILVASATNPNMMTAMEKAGAYVTDTGSMTCHAAIISRELNIPCIVGTKIATQVLKDGDLIEVDANIGIVKKL